MNAKSGSVQMPVCADAELGELRRRVIYLVRMKMKHRSLFRTGTQTEINGVDLQALPDWAKL
jgi:hypothetical protein